MKHTMSDNELARHIQEGSYDAFEILYHRHKGKLMAFCLQRIKQKSQAEDVFQSTWEKVYKKIHLFDTSQSFLNWLFSVCSNTFKDHLRKHKNLESFLDVFKLQDRSENSHQLNLSAYKLSSEEEKILKLKFQLGHSYQDIANLILLKPANVCKKASRALQKIKRILLKEEK